VLYLPVSAHVNQQEDPKTRERTEVRTELLLTVSNWHFNAKAQKEAKPANCTVKDCKVSLKFASDEFRSKKKDSGPILAEPYAFDKGGLQVSYGTFADLLSSEAFTHDFWDDVAGRYKESTGGADLKKLAARKDQYGFVPPPSEAKADKKSGKKRDAGGQQHRRTPAAKRSAKAAVVDEDDDDDDEEEERANNSGGDDERIDEALEQNLSEAAAALSEPDAVAVAGSGRSSRR